MPRLQSDLVDLLVRTCDGRLADARVEWDPRAAVCVVMAAEGYPGTVVKGQPIGGLASLASWTGGAVFHAGTRRQDGAVITDGGRVLGVTALGDTIADAIRAAYGAVEQIHWPGVHYRRDIGHRALARAAGEAHGKP